MEYTCPNCKKPICDDDALLCHFCGESLRRSTGGFMSGLKYAKPNIIFAVVIFLVLISFLILMIR